MTTSREFKPFLLEMWAESAVVAYASPESELKER